MGLDMYLTGEKFLPTDWKNEDNNLKEDGFRLKEKHLELGYWRKHPNLHGYIVNMFAGGEDECQNIDLSADDLRQIIKAIKDKELPDTQGFFFGESTGDEFAEDLKILNGAIEWVEKKVHNEWKSVVYRASW